MVRCQAAVPVSLDERSVYGLDAVTSNSKEELHVRNEYVDFQHWKDHTRGIGPSADASRNYNPSASASP